ncbi:MAG: hypothetical protein H7844_08600 [Nitrospirae bacterium YQR-1]
MKSFVIKGCRYDFLVEAYEGYVRTKIPLVGFSDGKFIPAGWGGSPGIYYFIPKIAFYFGLTIDQAINVFWGGLVVLSLVFSVTGFIILFKNKLPQLAVSFVYLFIFYFYMISKITEEYLVSPMVSVVFVPWILILFKKDYKTYKLLSIYFIIGFMLSITNLIRSHSVTGLLLFILTLVILHVKYTTKLKLLVCAVIVISMSIPGFYYKNVLLPEKNAFLRDKFAAIDLIEMSQPLWHSAYIGLAYAENDIVKPFYSDYVGEQKVKEINPQLAEIPVHSAYKEYHEILKKEFFKIVKNNPWVIIINLGTKLAVLYIYFLVFANIGIIASLTYKKPWSMELALWFAIAFNSLVGLIIVPSGQYISGFIAFSALYGLFSVTHAVEKPQKRFNSGKNL